MRKILTEYANTGFTLIENGDVEELIIHDPYFPATGAGSSCCTGWRI